MFTDGLQMLALNYAAKAAHEPFFVPMFQTMRDSEDHCDLAVPMRAVPRLGCRQQSHG